MDLRSQRWYRGIFTSSAMQWLRVASSLGGLGGLLAYHHRKQAAETDLADDPERLARACGPICSHFLSELRYPGAPQLKRESVQPMLKYMHKRAVEFGVPLDTPMSSKAFRLGFALGLLPHPNHPVEVQGFIGLFTWLVVQYDDIVGQNDEMLEESMLFQERFINGLPQKNKFLEAMATLLREARLHWDPVMANLLQISTLKFLTCNLLESHQGFKTMKVTRAGQKFPDFLRDLSGINVAYAVFVFPQAQYPDVGMYLEAIPDMARFIDISNDVLSFYKEELSNDTRNYIHNVAMTTGKPVMTVLRETEMEAVGCTQRVETILQGRAPYEESFKNSVYGLMAMHTTNPRYKLQDLGLAEEHPLAPMEAEIGEFFDRMKQS